MDTHTAIKRSLLIVDDDELFRTRLASAMEQLGFQVRCAASVAEALALSKAQPPAFSIVDLRLQGGSGLDLIEELVRLRADNRSVVLSRYGDIPSVVSAVKLGAVDFLVKPADAAELADALLAPRGGRPPPPDSPINADKATLEHIEATFAECKNNLSETARRLSMHRRTLQRILKRSGTG